MILSVRCLSSLMNKKIKLIFLTTTLILFSVLKSNGQNANNLILGKLETIESEVAAQKLINSQQLEALKELIENQNKLLEEVQVTNAAISTLLSSDLSSQGRFKDAFILNNKGVPYAFIDVNSNIYDYNNGNLLGFIDIKTNQIIRSYDQSPVAILDNDFLIDEAGHPIGSIERSETLRWDREKSYSKTQKTPVSHFFVMNLPRQVFIPTEFRFNSWSQKDISEVLYFDPERVQSQR